MGSKYYDWLSEQIEQHAKIEVGKQGYDHTVLTRLADAAGALKNRPRGAQAFGMTLPAEGVEGSETLVNRCLSIIESRAALLDDAHARDMLGALLQRHGLKAVVGPPEVRKSTHSLRVNLPVVVEAADSEEQLVDAETLGRLHGTKASGATLIDVPCVHQAVGRHNDPMRKQTGWATDGFAQLVFDPEARALTCQLVFSLLSEPAQREMDQLLQCIRTELFDTSWALNLEWVTPKGAPEVIVHIKPTIRSHELAPILDIG